MGAQDNVTLVRSMYDAFSTGDMKALLSMLAEDIDWHVVGPLEIPTAGTRSGRAEVAANFQLLSETEYIQEFVPEDFVAEGNDDVVFGQLRATVRSTGKPYKSTWEHRHTLRKGRIIRFREWFDTAAAVDAFR